MRPLSTPQTFAVLLVVAGFGVVTSAGIAQTPSPMNPMPPRTMSDGPQQPVDDAGFVRALNRANTSELETAKYVLHQTADPTVRGFAQHMIDDHSTAAVKLEAATRGTNLFPAPQPERMNGPGTRGLGMLQSESGTQLDNDYMRMQVAAHRRTLALVQWEAQNGQVAGLKSLASSLMATMQQHLQLAQSYLAAHNLTELTPPMTQPVPGHMNPNGIGPNGTPNNPASSSNGTTGGQNSPSGAGPSASPMPAASHAP